MSHGAGVLLGNMHYGAEQEFLRELNNSNTSGNLKSVYDMRLSHSRQSNRPTAGMNMKQKRKHLQSAVTRSNKPTNLTTGELQTFSQNNILPPRAPIGISSNRQVVASQMQSYPTAGSQFGMQGQQQQPAQNNYTSHSYMPQGITSRMAASRQNHMDMDIQVKGKGSIRTLIRLANSRAINTNEKSQE